MKRKLLAVPLLLFIFCCTIKKTISADAQINSNAFILTEDYILGSEEYIILDSGYYLFTSTDSTIPKDYFLGDYKLNSITKQLQQLTQEELLSLYNFSDSEKSQYASMCSSLIETVRETSQPFSNESYAVHVASQAVLYAKNQLEELYIFASPQEQTKPELGIAGNKTHVVNIDSLKTVKEIEEKYSATDNVDPTVTLDFYTNYSPDNCKVQTYFILVTAIDSSNNKTCAVDEIRVADFAGPTITLSESEITVDVYKTYDTKEFYSYFLIKDNVTPLQEIQLKWEMSKPFSTEYIDDFKLKLTARDAYQNESQAELTIHVRDRVKPTIQLKNNLDRITYHRKLDDEEIRSYLEVSDNYDKNISTSSIEILENTCDGIIGKAYNIKVRLTDESGNDKTIDIPFYLTDITAPIIYVIDVLYLDKSKEYTPAELLELLNEAGIQL